MKPKIAIVCPCYNEEEIIRQSADRLWSTLSKLITKQKIDESSFVLFVNDGSTDKTWEIIKELNKKDHIFKGLNLIFNSGHQFALLAGMIYVKDNVDAAITIDVDLQDDIDVAPQMIEKYCEGNDVVYGIKNKRDGDGFWKRKTAQTYYRLQRWLKINIVLDHADFRLVSSKVMQVLSLYKENSIYLRGIIPSLGFKSSSVTYNVAERDAGISKYTKSKMLKFAAEGIIGFSPAPLRAIIWIGVIFLFVALINGIDIIIALINGSAQPGWSQLMLSLWFIGGFILIALGLVGLYISRTYSQVKNRPRYIISETVD